MKRKITALLLSLLLLLALCVPALAAIEYGVFYDETEQLGSVELSYAAEQTLPPAHAGAWRRSAGGCLHRRGCGCRHERRGHCGIRL